MQVDAAAVQRIARLARIKVTGEEARALEQEISGILEWVEQLDEVDTSGVEPMTSVDSHDLKKRPDVVTDGGIADDVVANAPTRRGPLLRGSQGGGVSRLGRASATDRTRMACRARCWVCASLTQPTMARWRDST